MADDDRPRFSGRVPASGAPLTTRTLALRPNPQSLAPGDDNRTSSDVLADAVYGFLQNHPGLGVPEEGQRNLAEFVRGVNQLTPWGSAESAVNSAKSGDLVGTTSNLAGALPLVGAAGGITARVGKTAVKDATETVASNLAKRAVLTTGADAAESAAPAAAEAAAPVIKGRVRATPAAAEPSPSAPTPSVPDAVAATAQPPAPSSITDLPSLRRIPAAQGAELARGDPHLFPAEGTRQRTEGFFQGGPPNVNSLEELQAMRERVYDRLAGNYRGADWYDRYRDDVNRLTGGDPNAAHWMTNTEALFSPQRAPPQEFNAALKETSGPIAGIEQRANFEPQHQKVLNAIAQNDPDIMIKGQKVNEYAYNNDPARIADPSTWSATGTNDFRHGIEFGFPRGSNIGAPQHQFLDYETAQLVDRANREGLGNRTDWTGEQVQAALWVRQKAEDIMTSRPNLVRDRIAMGATPDEAYADAYKSIAFPEANSTLRESFPQHTLFATHEAQPFANIPYHMPASADADSLARQTFFDDPRSTWANAPGGRDALYAGMYPPDRPGAGMRVAPSTPMTGIYEPGEGKPIETNPGMVGQPMVAFNVGADKEKTLTDADRAIIQGVESSRAFIDAQGGSAATKVWPVNAFRNANAYFTPLGRPATADELLNFRAAGEPDFQGAMDTGQGMLVQNYEGPPTFTPAQRKVAATRLSDAADAPVTPVKAESVYMNYAPEGQNYWTGTGLEPIPDLPWSRDAPPGTPPEMTPGTGHATTKFLEDINPTPEVKAAITQNPYIPANAEARYQRDYDQGPALGWGAPWEAIQNARKIIAAGGDWPTELQKALKFGVPATTAAGVALTPTAGLPAEQQPPASVASSPGFDDWWQQLQNQRFSGS